MKEIKFILVWLFIASSSCKREEEITLYISNTSPFTQIDRIQVFVNDTMLLSQSFKYSDIVPNYDVFKFNLKERVNKLRVVELTYGIEKVDTINTKNDKYVFISFNEFKKNLTFGDTVKREFSILKRKEYTKLH